MLDATHVVQEAWAGGWAPDPELPIADWADANIKLSSKSAAAPGPFRTARTPYVYEVLECLAPMSPVQRVVLMWGAQLAKTQTMLNWIASTIDQWPGPMLMVQPTIDLAKKVSKQRIAPLIEETAVLRAKVAENKSRDSSNTLFEKEFPGGMLLMTGANSASGLRSMPIRYAACDEIDAYPSDVEGEGSPIDLAEKRTTTFARRKILLTSTPTIKGVSAIEREFERSDKRYFYVPCPHCNEKDVLTWGRVVWDEGKPGTARIVCKHCGALIDENKKTWMLKNGEWRATAVGDGTRGYHLSALYSPLGWKSWAECVAEFIAARDNPEKLKVWVNTVLGETWEERGDAIDPVGLKTRIETYAADVPAGVRILTASVDVQGDRLETKVKGWGKNEESWLIAYSQLHGDPGQAEVWNELDQFLLQGFQTEDGRTLHIDTTLIDSGGHHTDTVYRFCKVRTGRRVFALKGLQQPGKPIISNPSTSNSYRVKLFIVGVDAAKDLVVSRMKINRPGPGYMHLPAWVDDEYLEQLTAEKAIRKYVRGKGTVRQWVKTRPRNEAFDLEVYALAALYTRGQLYLRRVLGNTDAPAQSQVKEVASADTQQQSDATAKTRVGATPSAWGSKPRSRWGK